MMRFSGDHGSVHMKESDGSHNSIRRGAERQPFEADKLSFRSCYGWSPMKDFRKLKVSHKAHSLTLEIYRITATFPREELYGLTSQARRASSSIGLNLAEGAGCNGDREFARFCSIAMRSASELEYILLLARDLKLVKSGDYEMLDQRTVEVKRMLSALHGTLKADS